MFLAWLDRIKLFQSKWALNNDCWIWFEIYRHSFFAWLLREFCILRLVDAIPDSLESVSESRAGAIVGKSERSESWTMAVVFPLGSNRRSQNTCVSVTNRYSGFCPGLHDYRYDVRALTMSERFFFSHLNLGIHVGQVKLPVIKNQIQNIITWTLVDLG